MSLLPERLWGFATIIALFVLSCAAMYWLNFYWIYAVVVFGGLVLLGTYDELQTRHAVSRNYPVLAHFRYFLESIGPEIRQYFIEPDNQETPFSRLQRALVYQRA